jgi:hypothetical protein
VIKERIELGLRIFGDSDPLIVELEHRLTGADKLSKEMPRQRNVRRGIDFAKSQTTEIRREAVDFLLEQPLPTQVNITIKLMKKPGDAAVMGEQSVPEETRLRRHQNDTYIGELTRFDERAKT